MSGVVRMYERGLDLVRRLFHAAAHRSEDLTVIDKQLLCPELYACANVDRRPMQVSSTRPLAYPKARSYSRVRYNS